VTLKRTEFKRKPGAKGYSRSSGLASGNSTLSRGKGLAPVSAERQEENDGPWLETKRIVDERDCGRCQVQRFYADHRCSFGRHPHHVQPAKHGGDRLDPNNVATVCWSAHDWIHNVIGWQAFKAAWDGREA
jgi:hypothetical protein